MSIISIIPARGGSKGIPRKNIKMLAGKPLIAYNIIESQCSLQIDRVVVSTDDAEIAEVSKSYGAEIVWRPRNISDDEASSESALLYTLSYLKEKENYKPDLLVFLQCTSPLTLSEDIDGTINALIAEIGINHNGELDIVEKLIDVALLADCDAVKFQKRTP